MRIRTLFAILLTMLMTGCIASTAEMLTQVGAALGEATGTISSDSADAMRRNAEVIGQSSEKIARSFEDVTPEQEYYLGRAVAATVLSKYNLWQNETAIDYLNRLGQTLALFSETPETYGGFHFGFLDSDEINAFAAPGGLILISRGLVRICETEAELAAVIAHEIAHVEKKHGLRAIKKSRLTSALTTLALAGASEAAGGDLQKLTDLFGASITDITNTLMNSGYSRDFEYEADQRAVEILAAAGYPGSSLVTMLKTMAGELQPDSFDFAKTHPAPAKRIKSISADLLDGVVPENEVRILRFTTATRDI